MNRCRQLLHFQAAFDVFVGKCQHFLAGSQIFQAQRRQGLAHILFALGTPSGAYRQAHYFRIARDTLEIRLSVRF
jgi:hypothetical protein